MTPIQPPTPAQARDIAAGDAHGLLRRLVPLVLRTHPSGDAIVSRVSAGDELDVDYVPDSRLFSASLIGKQRTDLMVGSLADDAAAADLHEALGVALTTALNHEVPDRRRQIAELVEQGAQFVARLRVLAGTEVLVLALQDEGQTFWSVSRAQVFDDADRLLPETPAAGFTLH